MGGGWLDDWRFRVNGAYGKVYIYARTSNGWIEQASFFPINGTNVGSFGNALSLSSDGNTALIGAENSQTPGRAFVYIRNPNATKETSKKSNIILYPSVVNDALNIKTDATTTISDVQIVNTVGQVVYFQKSSEQQTINLQHLPLGMYVVSVRDTEGVITTGKIIKDWYIFRENLSIT